MLARRKLAPLFASFLALPFFVATACAGGATSPLGEEPAGLSAVGAVEGASETQGGRPRPPPRSCKADADCITSGSGCVRSTTS